jgi:hypothetical protein
MFSALVMTVRSRWSCRRRAISVVPDFQRRPGADQGFLVEILLMRERERADLL